MATKNKKAVVETVATETAFCGVTGSQLVIASDLHSQIDSFLAQAASKAIESQIDRKTFVKGMIGLVPAYWPNNTKGKTASLDDVRNGGLCRKTGEQKCEVTPQAQRIAKLIYAAAEKLSAMQREGQPKSEDSAEKIQTALESMINRVEALYGVEDSALITKGIRSAIAEITQLEAILD